MSEPAVTAALPEAAVLQALGLSRMDFDAHHHLKQAERWSPDLMVALAEAAQLPLTEELRWLTEWVRDYHLRYGNPPLMRSVVAALRARRDDPSLGSRAVYALVPEHPVRMACWLGGLPRPAWCL